MFKGFIFRRFFRCQAALGETNEYREDHHLVLSYAGNFSKTKTRHCRIMNKYKDSYGTYPTPWRSLDPGSRVGWEEFKDGSALKSFFVVPNTAILLTRLGLVNPGARGVHGIPVHAYFKWSFTSGSSGSSCWSQVEQYSDFSTSFNFDLAASSLVGLGFVTLSNMTF